MVRRALGCVVALTALLSVGASTASAQVFGTGPFSGLYFGVHGGYGWASNEGPSLGGSLGGVQAGYNLQLGSALIGVEADYTWANLNGRGAITGGIVDASVDTTWSARGRLGWVVANNLLIFGTAGYGGMDVSARALVSGLVLTGTQKQNGFVFGGGAEVLLTRSLMVRAEVLRYEMNSGGIGALDSSSVVRAALSYKF